MEKLKDKSYSLIFMLVVAIVLLGLTAGLALSDNRDNSISPFIVLNVSDNGTSDITAPPVNVTISVPDKVVAGNSFVARVNVDQVVNMSAFQFQLGYDPAIIQVMGAEGGLSGITPGVITSIAGPVVSSIIPIDKWYFFSTNSPNGLLRVVGRIPGQEGANGSGHLMDIHFNVLSSSGNITLTITPTDTANFGNALFDIDTNTINAVTWSSATLAVLPQLQIDTHMLPETIAGSSYSLELKASGGLPPYSWNATGLPGMLSLSNNGTISGSITTPGEYAVSLHVSDAANPANNANAQLNLRVYPPLQITTATLPEATRGVDYSTVISSGGGKTPVTWSAVGLPAGLIIDAVSGIISGQPVVAGDFAGMVITAYDAFDPPHVGARTLSIHINESLLITTVSLPEGNQGSPYLTVIEAGGGKLSYTWSGSGLPHGLTLDPVTGAISGTPAQYGNFPDVNITVTDSCVPPNRLTKIYGLKINEPIRIPPPLNLSPATVGPVVVGQTFNMDIKTNLSEIQPVDHVEVYVVFDPAKLAVVDADSALAGTQISSGSGLTSVTENTADNATGLISYRARGAELFPTGSFTVAKIHFLAKAATGTPTVVAISTNGTTTTSKVGYAGLTIEGTPVDASVQIIPGADVNFSVGLQGGSRPETGWVVPLIVKFFPPGASDVLTATPLYTFELTTMISGTKALAQAHGVIAAMYDISVISPHCLTNLKRGVSINGLAVDVDMGILLEGDANNDHLINISDFGLLSAAYGKGIGDAGYDARVDFDRNGRINISDFGLLTANYGKYGSIEIP
jgi:hypothetical protein